MIIDKKVTHISVLKIVSCQILRLKYSKPSVYANYISLVHYRMCGEKAFNNIKRTRDSSLINWLYQNLIHIKRMEDNCYIPDLKRHFLI